MSPSRQHAVAVKGGAEVEPAPESSSPPVVKSSRPGELKPSLLYQSAQAHTAQYYSGSHLYLCCHIYTFICLIADGSMCSQGKGKTLQPHEEERRRGTEPA